MFSIVITEKGGAQRQLDIESPEISIGRLEDNDICLPKSNVSKHHARLVFKDERYVLLDQKSTNGTYVNGRRISAPMVVRKGDKIYIGDFILTLAAPGGTFEGVSAREFRPRRGGSDAPAEIAGATDPPKQASPTRDELRRPSDVPEEGRSVLPPPPAVPTGADNLLMATVLDANPEGAAAGAEARAGAAASVRSSAGAELAPRAAASSARSSAGATASASSAGAEPAAPAAASAGPGSRSSGGAESAARAAGSVEPGARAAGGAESAARAAASVGPGARSSAGAEPAAVSAASGARSSAGADAAARSAAPAGASMRSSAGREPGVRAAGAADVVARSSAGAEAAARASQPANGGRAAASPMATVVSSTAPGTAEAEQGSAPVRPLARSVPPPLPSAASRATVPPPTRTKNDAAGAQQPAAASTKSVPGWSGSDANSLQSGLTSPAVLAPSLRLQGGLAMLMERLATEMNVARPEESAFPSEHTTTLERLMDELAGEGAIGPDLDRRFLREAAISEAVGLGPLDRLLANRSVRELVVDGPTRILADLGGGLSPVSTFFSDDSAVLVIARRLLHRAGRKLDENAVIQEARLPSGGFVQLLLPPLAAKGPLITVRCPPRAQSSPESLVTEGVLSGEMLAFLRGSVQQRRNVLVLGAMSAGVSSLLGVLTMLAPDHERIVTIENAPSGSLVNAQTIPLSRHARPDLTLDEFVKYASRLRHDRLVIDDLGAADALAALSAAAANPGVLLGMHAPTPETALLQLEIFAQAALGGVRTSLTPLLASALQVVVHIATNSEGARRVQSISDVKLNKTGALELTSRFRYDEQRFVKS